MKPLGPIPEGYEAIEGELAIGGRKASEWVDEAGGTPLFVYSAERIRRRIAALRTSMPERLRIHYAVKANPYRPILELMAGLTDGFDIASVGELAMATTAGQDPARISFAGPGKRDRELAAAIDHGITVNCESEGEVERALSLAAAAGKRPRLAVRVNPDFEIKGAGMRMGGGAKPFGIDSSRVPGTVRRIIDGGGEWRGFHIFAGSQALEASALIEAQQASLKLAESLAQQAEAAPPLVNLGGGFGIPYFHGEQPLDVEAVGAALAESLADRPKILAETQFAIELGRWIVGEAGVYLTRIVDRKESHGKTFLIVDGGMHHQLAASGNFGQVIRRNFPVAVAGRFGSPPEEEVSIVGCLCTPLDRLADDVMMPKAEPGDLVAIFLAGAYGLSASPQAFLAQSQALERLVGAAD